MKSLRFIFSVILLTVIGYVRASAAGPKSSDPNPANANDTSINFKSNIVIFKIIPGASSGNSNTNGSLKKAGKVARTSNSPHASIENVLYKKKGI